MKPFTRSIQALAALWILAATACCPPGNRLLGDPRNPYPLASPPKVGEFVNLPTGKKVSFGEMLSVAGDARIVYVGETHDNPASHRLELEVLKALSAQHPGRQALGMEMFVRSQQPILDRWVAGEMDEKGFLRESRWFENWNSDFAYYRDILNFARERRIPIIALNAEKRLVDEVRSKPFDQLQGDDRERLRLLDEEDPYQRAMAAAYFGDHSHGKTGLEGFLRVQTLWDETMAESVANYLSGPEGKDGHMLVIAGGNHVNYGFGIPRRVFRRLPTSFVTIGGKEIEIAENKKKQMMNVDIPFLPMVPYDFLAYIAYEELKENRPRLGVMIEPSPSGSGLLVREVVPGSNAARAGIEKGDVLLALDGEPLRDNLDLVYPLQGKKPGEDLRLKLIRKGREIVMDIPIRPAETKGDNR